MTGKRGGLEPAANKGLPNMKDRGWKARLVLRLLLGSVLFTGWGCEGGMPRTPPTVPLQTATSDPTEAQLLMQLEQKWDNPQAHYELARVYHKAQNWTKAEQYYGNALGFDPANKAAQAGYVKMFLDRGETAKAEQFANAYLRQAALAAPSVRELLRLGWEFRQLNLDDYALRCFQQAIQTAPDSFEANKQIGFFYRDKGDAAKAKQYLLRSFELNPRQPDVAGALGKLGVIVELPSAPPEPVPAKPK
jgi:tetratricopeptide (TPR) repeat protein